MTTPRPTVTVLMEGYAFSTSAGHPAFCSVFLIEGPDAEGVLRRVLVDPAHVGRRPLLWEALAERGLEATDIDFVVLTHAHWDHVQNIDVFSHAPLLLHPDEYRYTLQPHQNDWATPSWTRLILDEMEVREVEEGDVIIPGVGVVDMPGHSAGSIGITVETDAGMAIVTGDALHFAGAALTQKNPLVFWDPEQANASIARVVELGDIIYPGHDQPFRLTKEGEIEYLYGPSITIVGFEPDTPGVRFEGMTSFGLWVMPGIEEQKSAFDSYVGAAKNQQASAIEQGLRPDHIGSGGSDPGHAHDHAH